MVVPAPGCNDIEAPRQYDPDDAGCPAKAIDHVNRLLLKIALGGLFLAGSAAAKVIGEDSRRAAGEDEADLLSAVGYVVCTRVVDGRRRSARGTGTVVGSRSTVLSAAHVFVDEGGRGPRVTFDVEKDCTFRQYDATGELVVEAAFSHARFGEYRHNAGAPNHDWAVLRTAEPLPESSTPIPFAAVLPNELDARVPIAILAFHADVRSARRVPLLSEGTLFGVDYGGFPRLAHTADMGRMSSGAAIVHRTGSGQNVVVGVNRSAARLGDFNLAVPLSRELEEALRSYAHGLVPVFGERLASRPGEARAEQPILRIMYIMTN